MSRIPALVVPHTHWDRAWYWPAARLQVRLVECIDTLLAIFAADPAYRFTADGQVLMIEDYLETHPENRERIRELVRTRRLTVGPLYCQADLYCTGGEALIRNLLIGRALADELGGCQRTLYMPDTFGITPSIPLIAAGFGMQTVSFMRGLIGDLPGMFSMSADPGAAGVARQIPTGTRMFRWSSSDGSQVRVFHLRDGYANACDLGRRPEDTAMLATYDHDAAVAKLLAVAATQNDAQGSPLLLLAGVDHQIPQVQTTSAMLAASRAGAFDFRYASFDDLSDALALHPAASLVEYRGEFHGHGAASVLGGTISARIYLKARNAAAERLLIHQAEASAALAIAAGVPDAASGALRVAWKHLLMTHPHDDMCGCSVDAVHRDNEYHLAQAEHGADAIRRRMVRRLCEAAGGLAETEERFAFLMVNSQPTAARVRCVTTLDLEARLRWGDYVLPPHYAVVDESGAEVPFRTCARGPTVDHPHQAVTLELYPVLPPFAVQRFFIEARPAPVAAKAATARAQSTAAAAARPLSIANERLRCQLTADGTVTLTDRASGTVWKGLGGFSDQADCGDSYDFSDFDGASEELLTPQDIERSDAQGHAGLAALRLRCTLRLPAGLTPDASARRRARVGLPVEIIYSLPPGAAHLECLVTLTNSAADHRLRWSMPLPFLPTHSSAGITFQEVERTAPPQPSARPRVHPEHPLDAFVAVAAPDGARGLAVFSATPINYEVVHLPKPRLALTVLRAVGMLTRLGLGTRPSGAGPTTPTPEAQCLGRTLALRFALRPFAAAERSRLFYEAALWRAEPLVGTIEGYWPRSAARLKPGPLLSATDRSGGDPQLVVTACKPAEPGGCAAVVLRLFNPAARPRSAVVRIRGAPLVQALNLDETLSTTWQITRLSGGRIQFTVPPGGLRTLGLPAGAFVVS